MRRQRIRNALEDAPWGAQTLDCLTLQDDLAWQRHTGMREIHDDEHGASHNDHRFLDDHHREHDDDDLGFAGERHSGLEPAG